jgi:type II secretory pathway pseudopilin PulG
MRAMANRMLSGDRPRALRRPVTRWRTAGFAYVLLLIAISVIGVVAGSSLSIGSQIARRDAEQSLLAIGMEFQQALRAYAGVPAEAKGSLIAHGPRTLEELLKDPRTPSTRRYLRQIYVDPLTGGQTWGLSKDSAGFIVGVYSLAEGRPIKQTGFESTLVGFDEAEAYSSWIFGLPRVPLQK